MNASLSKLATPVRRSSYFVFAGLVGMVVAHAIFEPEKSWVIPGNIILRLALGWQVFAVSINPKRVIQWLLLLLYLSMPIIDFIARIPN